MKKHLIAASVAAALASPAIAQNVSIYGTLDATIASTKTTTSAGVSSTATTANDSEHLGSSVFGFRGTEDLGGGLKAFFQLEGDLNLGSGGLGSYYSSGTQVLFSRQANIGIEGAFGKVTLGRTADLVDQWEGYANFVQLFDTETAGAGGIGGKNGETVRIDLAAFNGISLSASYSSNLQGYSSNDTLVNTGNSGTTASIVYAQGPLTVGFATGVVNGGLHGTTQSATRDNKVDTVFAGYNFGFADVRLQRTSDVTSANAKNETTELSAKVPLGSGMYVVAHFEQNKFNGTNATTTADYSQFGALVAKDLSKRTAIFAGYRSLDRTNGTDTKITTGGLQHSF